MTRSYGWILSSCVLAIIVLILGLMAQMGAFHKQVEVKIVVEQLCEGIKNASLVQEPSGDYLPKYICLENQYKGIKAIRSLNDNLSVPVKALDHFCQSEKSKMTFVDGDLVCSSDFFAEGRF